LRRTIYGIMVALMSAACSGLETGSIDPVALPGSIVVAASASPFSQVTAGPVHALVPDGWQAVPAGPVDNIRGGFMASPQPGAWQRMDGSTTGMAATWVDATRVGLPSDFYYLAATGPLLSRLTHSDGCRPVWQHVFLDNRPSFASGREDSPGDYMARGGGTCDVGERSTRFAYFVAAPGFGPVRLVGIPSSGLYVVVAVMPDTARAAPLLRQLIAHTSFAGTSVTDFVATALAKSPL
jgi:hypothetical protein